MYLLVVTWQGRDAERAARGFTYKMNKMYGKERCTFSKMGQAFLRGQSEHVLTSLGLEAERELGAARSEVIFVPKVAAEPPQPPAAVYLKAMTVIATILMLFEENGFPEDDWITLNDSWCLNLFNDPDSDEGGATLYHVVDGQTKTDVWWPLMTLPNYRTKKTA